MQDFQIFFVISICNTKICVLLSRVTHLILNLWVPRGGLYTCVYKMNPPTAITEPFFTANTYWPTTLPINIIIILIKAHNIVWLDVIYLTWHSSPRQLQYCSEMYAALQMIRILWQSLMSQTSPFCFEVTGNTIIML